MKIYTDMTADTISTTDIINRIKKKNDIIDILMS